MFRFKQLDRYIISNFLSLFFATFFICSFIVVMQFLWMYIDELVGKGLPMIVLGELFFYNFLASVPLALPLAILLASLMTFGNMGERLELLAMKTAGISLFRIMRPLIVLVSIISISAFFFSNNVIPIAQKKMWTILFSIQHKSPELNIPVGEFYSGVNKMRMYIRSKNHDTGAMNNVMIYDFAKGFNNASVTTADTLYIKMTEDLKSLQFILINGETFENLEEQKSGFGQQNVPYRRESFRKKTLLIAFDANFNMHDDSYLEDQHVSKNFQRLKHEVDSISQTIDSIKISFAAEVLEKEYLSSVYKNYSAGITKKDSVVCNADSLFLSTTHKKMLSITKGALNKAENMKGEMSYRRAVLSDVIMFYARHAIEMHRKFTLSFACLVFFFIGAPLGAIIRKGGLGMPTVISVALFIFYFIIDTTSVKFAREGILEVWQGMWLSSFILLPVGIFLTYKAARDSALFNMDSYRLIIKGIITNLKGLTKK